MNLLVGVDVNMGKELEVQIDYHQILFSYIVKKYDMDIYAERDIDTNNIVYFFTTTLKHFSGTVNLDAIKFIELLQQRIEDQLKKIISTKSIYYWFHLYRRIPPVATFDNESRQTVWLYRNILENAFLKYGKFNVGNELIYNTKKRSVRVQDIASGLYSEALDNFDGGQKLKPKLEGVYLGKFGKKEMVEIFSLERLAYEFWYTTVCLRRIYKGGVLRIDNNQYWVENDSDTEYLMRSYDSRGGDFEDLSCSDGIMMFSNETSNSVVVTPKYNIEQLSLREYPEHLLFNMNIPNDMLEIFKPNFLWLPINFDHYYKSHEFYIDTFQRKFGYRMESFVYTLYLILTKELIYCRENQTGVENLKRAYRYIGSYKELANEIIDYYNAGKNSCIYTYELNKEEVIKVIEDLILPEDRNNISLVTLGPRYLFFPAINGGYIIDYSAILPILMTKMHFLNVKEETKGHLFEDVVIERLTEKKFNLWQCKKKLEHSDGTSKEIDISFIYKGFLFIGELKTHKMSLSFIKGDTQSLEFRKAKLKDALSQVDEKAKWLCTHTTGTNYNIPRDIKAIVPFVVTPFTEYIWSRSDDLWLTESIPRICTPSECEIFCNDKVIKSLATKPFTIYLT